MKLDDEGYKLICGFEGLRLKPYLCSAGVPTIGYGNTYYPNGFKVTMRDQQITQSYAFEIFKIIADKFAFNVSSLLRKEVSQNQFNALVSFAYNVGVTNLSKSTLLKLVNSNPNNNQIKMEFAKWNKAGGKVIPGLSSRRKKESDLYFTV